MINLIEFEDLLDEIAEVLPLAHTAFSKSQSLPFAAWFEDSSTTINADGIAVYDIVDIRLEVYHVPSDYKIVGCITNILQMHGLYFGSESSYISSEECNLTLFEFSVKKKLKI